MDKFNQLYEELKGGEAGREEFQRIAKRKGEVVPEFQPTLPSEEPVIKSPLQMKLKKRPKWVEPEPTPGIDPDDYTGYHKLTFADFLAALNRCYILKQSFIVFGEPGIGKSAGVFEFGTKMALLKGKEPKKLTEMSEDDIDAFMKSEENRKKIFLMIDQRPSQMEPTDLQGIPDINSMKKYMDAKEPKWIYLLCLPGADGILFLDEVNQAREDLENALFRLILDREGFSAKLAKDVGIFSAGNIGEFWAPQDKMKGALGARFDMAVLYIQPQEWLDWADRQGINSLILDFVRVNPDEYFYQRPQEAGGGKTAYPNPRDFEKLSKEMELIDKEYAQYEAKNIEPPVDYIDAVYKAAQRKVWEPWASDFRTFLESMLEFDWKEVIKSPKQYTDLEKRDMAQVWAFLAYLKQMLIPIIRAVPVEKIKEGEINVPEVKTFEQIVNVLNNSNPDWIRVLVSQIKSQNEDWNRILISLILKGKYDPKIKKEALQAWKEHVDILLKAAGTKAEPAKYVESLTIDELIDCICETMTPANERPGRTIYSCARFGMKLTEEGIQELASDPLYSLLYAVKVKNAPFIEGEQAIKSVPEYGKVYENYFGNELKASQKKFNSFVADILNIYEQSDIPTDGPGMDAPGIGAPNIGGSTPLRIAIRNGLAVIEERYNIDFTDIGPEEVSLFEGRFAEVKAAVQSAINSSDVSEIEKGFTNQKLNKIDNLISLLVTLTAWY